MEIYSQGGVASKKEQGAGSELRVILIWKCYHGNGAACTSHLEWFHVMMQRKNARMNGAADFGNLFLLWNLGRFQFELESSLREKARGTQFNSSWSDRVRVSLKLFWLQMTVLILQCSAVLRHWVWSWSNKLLSCRMKSCYFLKKICVLSDDECTSVKNRI